MFLTEHLIKCNDYHIIPRVPHESTQSPGPLFLYYALGRVACANLDWTSGLCTMDYGLWTV